MTPSDTNGHATAPAPSSRPKRSLAYLQAQREANRCAAADGPAPGHLARNLSRDFEGHDARLAALIHRAARRLPLFDPTPDERTTR